MDVLFFTVLIGVYIWVVEPSFGPSRPLLGPMILIGLWIAGSSLRRHGATLKRIGIRFDNLLPALLLYGIVSVTLAGVVLWLYRDRISWPALGPRHLLGWITYFAWGFAQQFCLLSFLLTRLRAIIGRDIPAVLLAASIFAVFHLPNPFLTVYSAVGGLVSTTLFLRWPNVFAAAFAHATASCLVYWLLPPEVFGNLWVGPRFWTT